MQYVTEALPYLLQQVANHQKALSSQHLLLHGHRALEQLNQKRQESGTAKHKDITSHTGIKPIYPHTHQVVELFCKLQQREETVGQRRKKKNKVIFRGCQQSAGNSSSPISSLFISGERVGSLASSRDRVWGSEL